MPCAAPPHVGDMADLLPPRFRGGPGRGFLPKQFIVEKTPPGPPPGPPRAGRECATRYFTQSLWWRCHCSIDCSGYSSNTRSWGPIIGSTQLALYLSIRWVRDGGTGRSVSIAEAKGCTSSGHSGLNNHSALAHLPQK